MADDRRTLAGDPDVGLTAGVRRITPVMPVPAQPVRLGGVDTERAAIQRIDAAAVFGTETVDLGHWELVLVGSWWLVVRSGSRLWSTRTTDYPRLTTNHLRFR